MKTEQEIKEIIRLKLIECRKEKGLTQTEVGLIVNKGKTAVASWEQGISSPDTATLFRLASYYNKTIGYMFGESDN